MAESASSQERSNPQGSVEVVPNRSGVGSEDKGLLNPQQDENTEKRRAKYGQNDERSAKGGDYVADGNVNDVRGKRNQTMSDYIRQGYQETGFGASMVA